MWSLDCEFESSVPSIHVTVDPPAPFEKLTEPSETSAESTVSGAGVAAVVG